METIKVLAMVFLGIWLILTGVVSLAGITLTTFLATILHLLALIAGVLILISIGKCVSCEKCDKDR